ncbi:MAG: pyridoxal-phosphate dependent enzyme, partial [Bdellovibrionota bacterium]
PKTASLIKADNTRALVAEVILEGDSFDEVSEITRKRAAQSGRTLIHAFEDPDIIAGQGTLALELLDQLPDLDAVIGSLGGGGMMTGVGI